MIQASLLEGTIVGTVVGLACFLALFYSSLYCHRLAIIPPSSSRTIRGHQPSDPNRPKRVDPLAPRSPDSPPPPFRVSFLPLLLWAIFTRSSSIKLEWEMGEIECSEKKKKKAEGLAQSSMPEKNNSFLWGKWEATGMLQYCTLYRTIQWGNCCKCTYSASIIISKYS